MTMESMLKTAENDFKIVLDLEKSFPDEYAVLGAMYHLQQNVEKNLKALLFLNGIVPEFTHNIAKLCCICEQVGINVPVLIIEMSDTLTQWESATRYDTFIDTSGNKYEKARMASVELREQVQNAVRSAEMSEPQKPEENSIDDR